MANPVDEVFGGGDAPESPKSPLPRLRRLLGLATLLNFAGPCCFTGVPGALLSIWVWTRADETVVLVENGALPESERGAALRLKNLAFSTMGTAALLILVQLLLFAYGVYEALFQFVLQWAGSMSF